MKKFLSVFILLVYASLSFAHNQMDATMEVNQASSKYSNAYGMYIAYLANYNSMNSDVSQTISDYDSIKDSMTETDRSDSDNYINLINGGMNECSGDLANMLSANDSGINYLNSAYNYLNMSNWDSAYSNAYNACQSFDYSVGIGYAYSVDISGVQYYLSNLKAIIKKYE